MNIDKIPIGRVGSRYMILVLDHDKKTFKEVYYEEER